jgi:hypothetical protein
MDKKIRWFLCRLKKHRGYRRRDDSSDGEKVGPKEQLVMEFLALAFGF